MSSQRAIVGVLILSLYSAGCSKAAESSETGVSDPASTPTKDPSTGGNQPPEQECSGDISRCAEGNLESCTLGAWEVLEACDGACQAVDDYSAACQPNNRCRLLNPNVVANASSVIYVGVVLPTFLGNAVQLAVEEVSDAFAARDVKIGFVNCPADRTSTSGTGTVLASTQHFVDAYDAQIVIGAHSSFHTKKIYEAVVADERLVISPVAGFDYLTELDVSPSPSQPGLLWRTSVPFGRMAPAIARDIVSRLGQANTKIAVVAPANEHEMYWVRRLSQLLAEVGVTVRVQTVSSELPEVHALKVAVDALRDGDYDEIVHFGIYLTAEELDVYWKIFSEWSEPPNLFLGLVFDPSDEATIPSNAQVRSVRPSHPQMVDEVYRAFYERYAARFGKVTLDDAPEKEPQTYDAVWLAAYGLVWATEQGLPLTGRNLAKGLQQLSQGQAIDVGSNSFQALVQQFRMGASVDIKGASGPLDYDPVSEERAGQLDILEAKLNDAGTAKELKFHYRWTP